jgi:large subunit ribosomal protein L9
MAARVQVLLLENIAGVGRAGDIVAVSSGYAQNFLFPQGKAALATKQVRTRKQAEDQKRARAQEKELETLQSKATQLHKTEFIFKARVKEERYIYGKISSKDIAKKVSDGADIKITPKQVGLTEPILQLGTQDVEIRFTPEITATIRVTVIADEKK